MRGLSKTVVTAFGRKPHSPFLKSAVRPSAAAILMFAIRAYRRTISPAQIFLFGPTAGCRFTPTCSQFALEAIRIHGALAGGVLAARRIGRCHPWGGCGHDPVPEKEFKIQDSEFRISPKHIH